MRLTYIFHSGFVIETQSCILIFDYWLDPTGVIPKTLSTQKPVYVFASHFHEDHFTKKILEWRHKYPSVTFTYILSKEYGTTSILKCMPPAVTTVESHGL